MEKRSSQSSLMLSCTGIFHMYLNKHPQDRNATFSAREETPKTLPYQVNTTSFCASFNVFTSEKYLTYSFLLTQKPCYPFRQIIGKVGGKLWAELSNSSKRTPCSVGSGALCHELPCSITEKGTCGDLSQHTMLSQNLFSLYVQFINCEEKKISACESARCPWICVGGTFSTEIWSTCGLFCFNPSEALSCLRIPSMTPQQAHHWLWSWTWYPSAFGPRFGKSISHLTCVIEYSFERKKEEKNPSHQQPQCRCPVYPCKHPQLCSCSPVQGFGHEARAQLWRVCVKYCALSSTKKRSVWCGHWNCCVYIPKRVWVKEMMTVVCVEGLKLWLVAWRVSSFNDKLKWKLTLKNAVVFNPWNNTLCS